MNKIGLTGILSRFGELTEADENDIQRSLNEYPYSQVLHVLMARVSRDLRLPSQERCLSHAAIYSTDRNILKGIMDAPHLMPRRSVPPQNFHETRTDTTNATKQDPAPPLTEKKEYGEVPEPYAATLPAHPPSENEVLPLIENTDTQNIEGEEIKTADYSPPYDNAYFESIRKNMDDLQRSKLMYEEAAAAVHPENWKKQEQAAAAEDAPLVPDRDETAHYEAAGEQIILKEQSVENEAKKTIQGRVTDENKQPLPGVNVAEKGTTNETVTDAEGRYSLSAGDEAALVFTFASHKTQEISAAGRTIIDAQEEPLPPSK